MAPKGVLKSGDNVIALRALSEWNNRVQVGHPGPMTLEHESGSSVVDLAGEWRYAWADNPECNLVNREGLPASPFRTDTWPGITE